MQQTEELALDIAEVEASRNSSIERDVVYCYESKVKEAFMKALFAPDFDPEETADDLKKVVRESAPRLLDEMVSSQKADLERTKVNYPDLINSGGYYRYGMDLLKFISPDAKNLESRSRLSFIQPEQFIDDVEDLIANRIDEVTCLGTLSKSLKKPAMQKYILPFIREWSLLNLSSLSAEKKALLLESLFNASGNRDFTLEAENPEDFHFLVFLPRGVRRILINLLINNAIIADLRKQKPEAPDSSVTRMRECLIELARISVVINSQVRETIASGEDCPEDIIFQLAQSKSVLSGLSIEIESLAKDDLAKKALIDFLKVSRNIEDEVSNIHSSSKARHVEQIDVGHGFSTYVFSDLHKISRNEKNVESPLKNGWKAVIFEDESAQANLWTEAVNNRTPYQAGVVSDSLPKVLDAAEERENRFFILDVSQPGNPEIGIEVARQILEKRVEILESKRIEDRNDVTIILVWSSDPNLVERAKKVLKPTFDRLNAQTSSGFIDGFNVSRPSDPIKIQFLHKTKDLGDCFIWS